MSTNKMSNFSIFIFRIIVKIHQKLGCFEYKNDHNSRKKNRKNLKFDFSFDSPDCGFWKKKLILIFHEFFFFSKVVKFTRKIRKWLNQKKNWISDFSDFFFELRSFLWCHHPNFRCIFHENSSVTVPIIFISK